jgi:hypothetical protein
MPEKRTRKTSPCRIYRLSTHIIAAGANINEGEEQEMLVPVGQQYQTVASAMSGLKEHVRLHEQPDAEAGRYVIARIQAEVSAKVEQRTVAILTEGQ